MAEPRQNSSRNDIMSVVKVIIVVFSTKRINIKSFILEYMFTESNTS